jgi:hypothetical protein
MTDGLRLTLEPDPPITVIELGPRGLRIELTQDQADALVRCLTWSAVPEEADRAVVWQVVQALAGRRR